MIKTNFPSALPLPPPPPSLTQFLLSVSALFFTCPLSTFFFHFSLTFSFYLFIYSLTVFIFFAFALSCIVHIIPCSCFAFLYLIYFPATFSTLLTPSLFLSCYPFSCAFLISSASHLSVFASSFLPFLLSKFTHDTHLFPLSPCRVEAAGYQRVLQVDLEVNGLMVTQGGREVMWQVEYPLTRTLTSEVPTLIRLAPQDLGGIVPLAMVRWGGTL